MGVQFAWAMPTRYHKISHDPAAIEGLFVDLFVDAHKRVPNQIILDVNATDDSLHGSQERKFFHGYYDTYCYLPLYIFSCRHLLAAKLRRSNLCGNGAAHRRADVARHRIRLESHEAWADRLFVVAKAVQTQGERNQKMHLAYGWLGN